MKKIKRLGRTLSVLAVAVCMAFGTATTAFAFVDESAVEVTQPETEATETETETTEEATPFSVVGNAEVLDDIDGESSKEFFTITTKDNSTYFLIIDRASTTENVYMLSLIDDYDLQDFLQESETAAETEEPSVVIEDTTPTESESPEPVTEETEQTESGGMNTGFLLMVLVVAAAGAGAFFYFKIYKPEHEDGEADSENLELGDGLETINEDVQPEETSEDSEESDEDE